MAKSGKLQYTAQEVVDAMHEYGGIIKDVALHLQMSRTALYNYMDRFPEISEAQILADRRLDRHDVETAYEANGKLIEKVGEDPTNAFKAISLVLKGSKASRYYNDKIDDLIKKVDAVTEIADKLQRMQESNKNAANK
jgi:hypothetical protein